MAPASPIAWASHIPGGTGLEELTATICRKGAEGSKCLLNSFQVRTNKHHQPSAKRHFPSPSLCSPVLMSTDGGNSPGKPQSIPRKAAGFSWKAHVSPSCLHKNHWRQQCNKHSPNKRNSFPEKTQLRVPQRARGIPTLLFVTRLSPGRAELDNPHSSVSSALSNFTPGHRCLLKSDPTKCWIQHYQ